MSGMGDRTSSPQTAPPTILLVEDDVALVRLMRVAFEHSGHRVLWCDDADRAVQLLVDHAPDVVLLDVMLPGADGHEIAARLRARADVPIVFVTARTDPGEAVLALRRGGDDYVRKPFALDELVARVEAVLRRRRQARHGQLAVGDLVLDEGTYTALLRGAPIALTVTEYRLLRELVRRRNRIVERRDLLIAVWGADVDGGALDTTVSRLRRKLDGDLPDERNDDGAGGMLRTRRGIGYGIFGDELGES